MTRKFIETRASILQIESQVAFVSACMYLYVHIFVFRGLNIRSLQFCGDVMVELTNMLGSVDSSILIYRVRKFLELSAVSIIR